MYLRTFPFAGPTQVFATLKAIKKLAPILRTNNANRSQIILYDI